MLTRIGRRTASESGQVVVLFALLIPIFFGLGAIVMTVGNWYVHKRHLQTQVDAAAFAGGTQFIGCFDQDTRSLTNDAIRQAALKYAGDTRRDNTTFNLQVQEPNDVFAAINSANYWSQVNGTDPSSPTAGYGLDFTLDSADPDTTGDPCNEKYLDVKATDNEVPLLFPWLPLFPSPKAHAKVEIQKIKGLSGMLPWAIPEIDPKAVAVLFVDEEAAGTDPILGHSGLLVPRNPPPCPPAPGVCLNEFSIWSSGIPADLTVGDGAVQDDRARIGAVVVVSELPSPVLSGSVSSICSQDPGVKCFAGPPGGPSVGPYFIHGYAGGGSGSAILRQVRLENLTCGADNKSAPWFLLAGDCEVRLRAVIDFGVSGDPTLPNPPRASVQASPGGNMTWGACADDPDLGCWLSGSITLPEAGTPQAGRQNFSINWGTNPPGGGPGPPPSGTFAGVAHPYVADQNSGPVEYLTLNAGANPADSVGFGPNTISVTVGLARPLKQTPKLDPPILLRFKKSGGSLSQTVNCDVDNLVYDPPFKPGFDLNTMPKDGAEIAWGCATQYNINGTGPCPTQYDTTSELPPTTTTPTLIPTCAEGRPGQVNSLRTGLDYRFEQPCTPNYWPTQATDPYPLPEDPRYVILIVTDYGQFDISSERVVKIRRFAGFYATGWDISGPGGDTQGCDDPDGAGPLRGNDPHPIFGTSCPKGGRTCDDGDVWGHFVTFTVPNPAGTPADELCNFDELGICIAVLTE